MTDGKAGGDICPHAKSEWTPCAVRDGWTALTADGRCVGCGRTDAAANAVECLHMIPTPGQGKEERPWNRDAESAFWEFDTRRKGYADWQGHPQSERDAFKQVLRDSVDAAKYVPGLWRCDECGLRLTKKVIARDGVGIDASQDRPSCLNDGELMLRVLWKEYTDDLEREIERLSAFRRTP